jgi:hypothetical protein
MRQGDFSEILPGKLIYDPVTRVAFAGNIIPQNRFSNVSKNVLALIPQPTNGNLVQNYLADDDQRQQARFLEYQDQPEYLGRSISSISSTRSSISALL